MAYDEFVTELTPIGEVHVAFNDRGVSCVVPGGPPEVFQQAFETRFGRAVFPAEEPRAVVSEWFRTGVAGPIDLSSVREFDRDVLEATSTIPRGETRSYQWVAETIGRPRAMRAVGSALGRNPVPFLVPCHRVIRSDGTIGQYGLLGVSVKRALLLAEDAVAA